MGKFILREGFWRSEDEPELPLARARATKWRGQAKFLAALTKVQESEVVTAHHAKGWSTCRCCGCKNGSVEYGINMLGCIWRWPVGYMHYIKVHNIRPSLAFQEYILQVAASLT